MFWDNVAPLYNFFENIYNGSVNRRLCQTVASLMDPEDRVLECACGAGMLTTHISKNCRKLIATDFSSGMLKQAAKACKDLPNVTLKRADITKLRCKDNSFDKVVAGNVIHLLDDPATALRELERVCRPGGRLIIPTYINFERNGSPDILVRIFKKLGADFKQQFDFSTYQEFFSQAGYPNAEFILIEGKMPCAIAIITKEDVKHES
ncbi:MAG: methyltransferase domain-containing protein [Lachnospiraceae bacterium]|nr:methyltransferase domain-containing protein [Lachnospiraceae bacterium]